MNREIRTAAWWYWLATLVALVVYLSGFRPGLGVAIAVTVIHAVHTAQKTRSVLSLPMQVRLVFLLFLLVGALPPAHVIHYLQVIGTTVRLTGYCMLGRILSLLPWNRRRPLSWRLVWRTFATPPTHGSILQVQC
jgi:hypothetical protein